MLTFGLRFAMLSLHKKEDSLQVKGEYLMNICSAVDKTGKPGKVFHFL